MARTTEELKLLGQILDELKNPSIDALDPATTDPAATDSTSSWNQNSLLRGILQEALNENLEYIANFISAVDSATSSTITSNGQILVSGTPTDNSYIEYELTDLDVFALEISGTWTGVLQFEKGSVSAGSNYTPMSVSIIGKEILINSTSSNGYFVGTGSGGGFIRIRATTLSSGTATVVIKSISKQSIQYSIPTEHSNSSFRSLTVNSTAQSIKATPGIIRGWNIVNPHAAAIYVKFYNIASGSVNPASSVPILTIMIPATSSVYQANTCNQRVCNTAISVRAVTDVGDTGTTAAAALPIIEVEYR
jgi:hypothetical protein